MEGGAGLLHGLHNALMVSADATQGEATSISPHCAKGGATWAQAGVQRCSIVGRSPSESAHPAESPPRWGATKKPTKLRGCGEGRKRAEGARPERRAAPPI